MVEAFLGATVRELTAPVLDAFVLLDEHARPFIHLPGQRIDAFVSLLGLGDRCHRIVRGHQPQRVSSVLGYRFQCGANALLFVEGFEDVDELVVAPIGHGDDEF